MEPTIKRFAKWVIEKYQIKVNIMIKLTQTI